MRINRLMKPRSIYSKTEHCLIGGLSGYGKGVAGEGYVPKFVKKGYKVFDINSESRGEGMYYSIPQSDSKMKQRLKYLSNGRIKPQGYKNEIIMFLGNNLRKMEKLPSNVKVCVFNEEWLENEDIRKFLSFNERQSETLEAIFELNNDKKILLSGLYKFFQAAAKDKDSRERKALTQAGVHSATIATLKRRLRVLLRSGLFYNEKKDMYDPETKKGYFHYLDLMSSLKQVDTITSYSTYLIEDPYIRYVCIGVLIKKFIELIETRQANIPILFYIREANDFYYMQKPPAYVIDIQTNIEKMLRKGRSFGGSKVTVVIDTQLLGDLPDSVFNQFNKFMVFKLPTSDSKKLLRKATIPELYLNKLAHCDVGQGMYVANGMFEYPILYSPSLSMKSDPKMDVFDYLINRFGFIEYKAALYLELVTDTSEIPQEFPTLSGG